MTVESKIVYRADASEVDRATRKLEQNRAALNRLQATGGGADPRVAGRVAVVQEQIRGKLALQHQRLVGQIVTNRQKSEIALDRLREQVSARGRQAELKHANRLAAVQASATRKSGGPRIGQGPGRAATSTSEGDSIRGRLEGSAESMAIGVATVGVVATGMFAKAVIDAQAFRESTTLAMKAYLGSASAANTWFDRALALSIELKQNSFDTIEGMTRLRGAGFDDKSVENLTRAFADIKRLAPDADLKSIAIRLAQIRATGKLQGDELNELANAWPAARDVIFKQMMRDTGKTMAELQSMQRAGKITPDMVEKALLGGVSALTKMPLGEFAKANADTIRGLWDQITAIPSQMLLGLDKGKDMDRIRVVMKDIVSFFDGSTSTGKEAKKVIGDVFTALVTGFLGLDPNTSTKEVLSSLVTTLKEATPDIRRFASGVATIAGAVSWLIGLFASVSSAGEEGRESMNSFGQTLLEVAGWLKYIPIFAIPSMIFSALLGIGPQISAFASEMWTAGANLIQGLIDGIKSKITGVASAATSAASAAVGAVTGALGIHSPSTVAKDWGYNVDKGFAMGLERFAWMPQQAANDVAVKTADQPHPSLGAATTVNNASASHTFAPVNSPSIVVGPGASPEAVKAAYEAQAEQDAWFDAMAERHYARKAGEVAA